MFEKLKEIFWFKILGKCPDCKSKLSGWGSYPQKYSCDCGWGK